MSSSLIAGAVLGAVIVIGVLYRRTRRRRTDDVSPGRAVIASNLVGSRRRGP
jgi:hypothetical protein